MIGIKDVAKKANVSASTVSRVLNNYPNIAEETRERVLKVIEELGYFPNIAASTLSSKQKSRTALYIYVNDRYQQIDEINMMYILGVFDKARALNMDIFTVFDYSLEKYSKEEYVNFFRSKNIDSIIVIGLNRDDKKMHYLLKDDHFKFVVVDTETVNDSTSCVLVDQRLGQYEVAKRIVKRGDRVLYLEGKQNGYVSDMRLEGMKQLAKDMDLKLHVETGEFSEKKAYLIVKNRKENYDAIVCASDLMALGAKKALGDEDIPVSGFDGIRLLGYVAENVITCKQNFYLIGQTCVEAINDLLKGEKGKHITVPHTIGTVSYESIIG